MQLYSTRHQAPDVSLREAVLRGLPPDNGLYMPREIKPLAGDFFSRISELSLPNIGYAVCQHLFNDYIPPVDLRGIIDRALSFPAPLVQLVDGRYVLELFHGPSLAFKDFGAAFMAELMSYFNRGEDQELVILVATSGDTGGAVAAGFAGVPGIRVCILYPSGKVSDLQEKQLTTHGDNITALEVDGTFDDCQDLVKKAFLDGDLTSTLRLTSANSINIARLIPQSFYYFEAYKQLGDAVDSAVFSVPSGNLGNLTAGILAQRLGLPVAHFVSATNVNDVFPTYLVSGSYDPRTSRRTLSNAMDVGDPSNFRRLEDLYCSTWNNFRAEIAGFSVTDEETESEMCRIYQSDDYIMDPHTAVGSLALSRFLDSDGGNAPAVVLSTAHPAKFKKEVDRILGVDVPLPSALSELLPLEKQARFMSAGFSDFKSFLLDFYR